MTTYKHDDIEVNEDARPRTPICNLSSIVSILFYNFIIAITGSELRYDYVPL
jgi:hypothetical protein